VPTFINGYIHKNELEDEWHMLRLGQDPDTWAYSEITMGLSSPSSNRTYIPDKNDKINYKFISFDLFISLNKKTIERESYQVLDFLGDVGGLLDLCKLGIGLLITWVAEAKLLNMMSRQMFVLPTKNKKLD
jgi:hypothetical protein